MLPLSVPHIRGNEWKYIKECLDTEWVSSVGKYVVKFEEDICNHTGAKHAIACVNGTAALQIALTIVGVQPEDEVVIPTLTFIAPVNAIRYVQANPVFMDADDCYTLDIEKTLNFIKSETTYKQNASFNKNTGKHISAILPVHVFGNAVDLEKLYEVCVDRNIRIIEDAAESIGTYYTGGDLSGKHTGTIGDVGCYSFNGNKIVTAGGGGMIVTNNEEFARKAKYLTTQAKDDEVYYVHNEVGFNYRLTNLQAALGVAQLEQLQAYIDTKRRNYYHYKNRIDKIPGLCISRVPQFASSNYWFYCLQIEKQSYGKTRDELMELFRLNNIQSRPIWQLNHLQTPYRNCQSFQIEKAYSLLEHTLNIPCSVNITEEEIERVIEVLESTIK